MARLARWVRLAHTELTMPALTPTMKAGGIVSWKKAVGDSISPGEVVAEIETDKAVVDFETQEEGFLAKVVVHPGATDIKVGTLVGIIVDDEAELVGPFPDPQTQAPGDIAVGSHNALSAPTPSSSYTGPIGPAVGRLVARHALDLSSITPTGRDGRILKGDVLSFLAEQQSINTSDGSKTNDSSSSSDGGSSNGTGSSRPPQETQKSAPPPSLPPASVQGAPAATPPARYTDRPVSNMRKTIATRLLESKTTVPHFYATASFDLNELLELRQDVNRAASGPRISVNDFFIRAAALALEKVRVANSEWNPTSQSVWANDNIDISFAVAVEKGLFTPIIKSANRKSLAEVSAEAKDLVQRAHAGKLLPEDYIGGTFSISNLGMFGVSKFQAIINPPQACNLAVGAAIERVVARDWKFQTRTVATGTLSSDSRVLNEADANQFLAQLAASVSAPETLL